MPQSTDLPVGPLLAKIEARIEHGTTRGVCGRLGVNDRKVRDWRAGSRRFVSVEVAERVLDGAGWSWWDVWGPEDRARCGVPVAMVFKGETEPVAA
jgi:hypothetical protein